MCSSTIFRNFTIPVENKSLILIGNDIASEKYKPQVEEIRQLIARGKTEQAQEKKRQLLAFTPSATFKEKRQLPFLETYSSFVHLDFDKLTAQQLQDAFETIAGIPKQIQALIPSAENGLFSRFMFYQMNMSVQWDDVFATKTEFGLDRHFEALGNQFYALYHALKSQPDICFSLTESQQKRFNDFFRINQSLYITIHEDDYIGTVRRLGLTAFRMMMIFSALRITETGEISDKLVCSDEDFENTLRIIAVLLRHSSYVYTQIAEPPAKPKGKKKSELFLEALPYKFNRQDYVIISKKLDIIDKTAQGYLKKFVDAGAILHSGHDQYINPAANPAPEK